MILKELQPDQMTQAIYVRLTKEMHNKIKKYAKLNNVSVSTFARAMIDQTIRKLK